MDTYRLRIYYGKTGIARFISGKNLQKIIERTLRRARAPLKFTEGFSPHPRISYGHPLPVNISGDNESFDVFLIEKMAPHDIINRAGVLLPEGLCFHTARWVNKEAPSINSRETYARYTLNACRDISAGRLERFGQILELGKTRAVVLIKINNFNHKSMIQLLIDGTLSSIERSVVQEKGEDEREI